MANFQFAADTAANWASNNRTPLLDEVCFESDSKRSKLGDGSTAYNTLPYLQNGANGNPLPTGYFAESYPRGLSGAGSAGVSGTPFGGSIAVQAGQLISTLSFVSSGGITAGGSPHQWAALADLSGTVLAVSADLTSSAWTAATPKAFAMGTPYRVPTSGALYYVLSQVLTTLPSVLRLGSINGNLNAATIPPLLAFTAPAGASTPPSVGSSLGTLTVVNSQPYCLLS